MDTRLGPDDPALGRLFTDFQYTAFRLETLPAYNVGAEDEAYRRFLAGEPAAADPETDGWARIVKANTDAGKVMQRVHIVPAQLTPYLEFEFSLYPLSVAAGEDVRILPAGDYDPEWDFWLFDSSRLWIFSYDEDGRFLGAERVFSPAAIAQHCAWRDRLLHEAVRFPDYIRQVPELRRAS